jgi:hypothetical protein
MRWIGFVEKAGRLSAQTILAVGPRGIVGVEFSLASKLPALPQRLPTGRVHPTGGLEACATMFADRTFLAEPDAFSSITSLCQTDFIESSANA